MEEINSVEERLKLDAVTYGQQGIFMDLRLTLINGNLQYDLYQKPSNTFAYIPPSYDHPRSMFKSFVLEELKRYYRNSSTFEAFTAQATLFKNWLHTRGYPNGIFDTAYHTLLTQHLPINLPASSTQRRTHALSQPQPQPQPPPTQRTTLKKTQHGKNKNKYFSQPILIINLPVYNHNIEWRQFITVPENLRDTLNFHLAYKSHDIIISKCSPRTLGSLYISSKF